MKCSGCREFVDPTRAEESVATSPNVDNYTYACQCGQRMTWTGRSRTEPARPEPRLHVVGTRFGSRGITGTALS